ncbi:MAG: triose-phosphate isomerase [Clostridia bacterium]|nr:triose-phosphate isomerase [Clostridia bacterium]
MDKTNRKVVIAGNWKMNKTPIETAELINELKPKVSQADCEVVVCVPFVDLPNASIALEGSNIKLGAQNCHFEEKGAFTGEISVPMLKSLGVEYVIIGHSERRQYFAETDETVSKKIKSALNGGLKVILCVGESLEQREAGITFELISTQIKIALAGLSENDLKNIIVAYEPIWAIGTGKTATAEQADEVCGFIRNLISQLYDEDTAKGFVIQYGGSMNAKNAEELLDKENVDGGLIGGASLKAEDFSIIVKAASEQKYV